MRGALLLFTWSICSLGPLRAQMAYDVSTEKGSGIQIKVETALGVTPRMGYLPVQVTISNRASQNVSWLLRSESQRDYSKKMLSWSENKIGVTASGESSLAALLPVFPMPVNVGFRPGLTWNVQGPDVTQGKFTVKAESISSGMTETAFVAMSKKLEVKSWGELQESLKKKSRVLVGSEIDFLPVMGDWRAWLGIDVLWMTPEDFAALSAELRAAIHDWLLQGGQVVFCLEAGQSLPSEFLAPSSATERDLTEPVEVGLGSVRGFFWDGIRLDIEKAATEIQKFEPRLIEALEKNYKPDQAGFIKAAGKLGYPVAALMIVLLSFAVTMGPLNLYWFAPVGKRHYLFFTVPLISGVAALLLGALILIYDGTGGSGARVMLRFLDADHQRLVIIQEQASKTGLLLSREFPLSETAFIAFVPRLPMTGDLNLGRRGDRYEGDWFSSRSLQTHFLESVGPSREALELLNPDDLASGAAPVVLSSIPATLDELRWLDASGREWGATNISAGQRTTLEPLDAKAVKTADFATKAGAGSILQSSWKRAANRPGYFYALSAEVPEAFLPTLPSIRWGSNQVLWCGRIQENQHR